MEIKNKRLHLSIIGIDSIASYLKEYKISFTNKLHRLAKDYRGYEDYKTSYLAIIDSSQILNRIYKEKKNGKYALAHGYYYINEYLSYYCSGYFSCLSPFKSIVGVKLDGNHNISNYGINNYPHDISREIIACFKEGIPAHEWEYIMEAKRDIREEKADTISKKENYKDGLLHGDYIIYNKRDTLYDTVFEHGTGYYKEYFPNGSIWMEGQVIEGYPDGKWQFYHYKKDGEWYKTIVEEYENRELISTKIFYSQEEVKRMEEEKRLIEKSRKKWWQFWKRRKNIVEL